MIEVKGVTKYYGNKKALNNISFKVEKGEILGFLGPNGAGKSTTMNILTGYISCSEGSAIIQDFDILKEPIKAKKAIGYLPEHPPLYLDMTVFSYLSFIYELKKVSGKDKKKHIQEICELVKITDVYGRLIKNLSKGYRQRVGLAQALIGSPDVLILDEPTVGLDPKQIIEIRNVIKKLSDHHTVILSSHILSEVQATCDRVIVINNGMIIADDTSSNLSNTFVGENKYIARIEGPSDLVKNLLDSISEVSNVTIYSEREPGVFDYSIECCENSDIRRELFKRLAEKNWYLLGLRSSELSLEEIFLKLTNDTSGGV